MPGIASISMNQTFTIESMERDNISLDIEAEVALPDVGADGIPNTDAVWNNAGEGTPGISNAEGMHASGDWARRIEQLVDEHQLFLRHNLVIADLASLLGTNRLYVSRIINAEMGMTFSEYINRKRVFCAIDIMRNEPQLSIIDVYTRAGFSSEKSFYRNFKLFTKESPKKYILN